MLKKCHLVALCSCLSFSAIASTIEYTPDEEMTATKSWYTEKDWYPKKSVYPVNKYSGKYQRLAPVKTVAPLKIVPKKVVPKTVVPFPARIAPAAENKYPWSVTGSVGYSGFSQAGDSSGGTVVGRFSIGKGLYIAGHTLFGLELGVQNGNRMSIGESQATLDEMGSLPIWTTSKPMVDLLATAEMGSEKHSGFLVLKAGIAYRTWETERQSINNLSQIGAEVQAGVGMHILPKATLSLLYQGVYGGSNNFTVHPDHSATVTNIPIQNGLLLSLALLL